MGKHGAAVVLVVLPPVVDVVLPPAAVVVVVPEPATVAGIPATRTPVLTWSA
ncbi:MAG: hypothetical protein QOF21_1376 [Actinomycetota bacterium]|jgi:hypothetical protein